MTREIRAVGGVLRPPDSDRRKTKRPRELLQRVRGSLRQLWNGSGPPWGNWVGGRAATRSLNFRRRPPRADEEIQQPNVQITEIMGGWD